MSTQIRTYIGTYVGTHSFYFVGTNHFTGFDKMVLSSSLCVGAKCLDLSGRCPDPGLKNFARAPAAHRYKILFFYYNY